MKIILKKQANNTTMDVRVYPPDELIETTVTLPLSKSISNRALIMNALTAGSQPLTEVAKCDDTDAMVDALASESSEINIGAAGTAMRFLTAYFAAKEGAEVVLDGSERMRQRPIGVLVDALRACGADIQYAGEEGFPPLKISGKRLHGGVMEMDATVSSQFISALLMVAPTFDSPLTLTLKGEISSLPYLDMTIEMMRRRGIDIERANNRIEVKPSHYQPCREGVERDWSAASYWYEVAALTSGWITLEGLTENSLQGDSQIAKIFHKLGIDTEFNDGNAELIPSPEVYSRLDVDLSDTPDVAQTLAVTCCMLGVPFHFTGLESLKIKETDRLEALKRELAKLSFDVEIIRGAELRWEGERIPVQSLEPIDTYADHRMAMAFGPVGIFLPGIMIRNAEVVSKSYPEYWDHLRQAGLEVNE